MNNELKRVRDYVVDTHQFITDWVRGDCPGDRATYEHGLLSRFSKKLMVLMPGGKSFEYPVFTKMMYEMHGSNPKFVIKIRNVDVRHRVGDVLVVTYEEWERNAIDSTPPDNGRFSTMVLKDRGDDFEILHVHETWLPAEVMAAGPYNF